MRMSLHHSEEEILPLSPAIDKADDLNIQSVDSADENPHIQQQSHPDEQEHEHVQHNRDVDKEQHRPSSEHEEAQSYSNSDSVPIHIPPNHNQNDNNNASHTESDTDVDDPLPQTQTQTRTAPQSLRAAADASKNIAIKATVICTWVPTSTAASEVTVIGGDLVTVLDSEPIALSNNPLHGDDIAHIMPTVIVLKCMHWTRVRLRNHKMGVVPSNVLSFASNPIRDVWIRVKAVHAYSAKNGRELSLCANDKLQIHGCVNDNGMVRAKTKKNAEGLVPYNFIEIASASTNSNSNDSETKFGHQTQPSHGIPTASYFRSRAVSSPSGSNDFVFARRPSDSASNQNNANANAHETQTTHSHGLGQLNFVIDDADEIGERQKQFEMAENANGHSLGVHHGLSVNSNANSMSQKKAKLTSRMKQISSNISTTIDKIQYASYSHGAAKTLALEPTSNPFEFGNGNDTTPQSKSSQTQIAGDALHSNELADIDPPNATLGMSSQPSESGLSSSMAIHVTKDEAVNVNSNVNVEVVPRAKQTLPLHWPFSSYPISRRSRRSKCIETGVLSLILLIYALPVVVEDPLPDNAPAKYNIWWINFFLAFVPSAVILVLRVLELWTHRVDGEANPNNRVYATWLFYDIRRDNSGAARRTERCRERHSRHRRWHRFRWWNLRRRRAIRDFRLTFARTKAGNIGFHEAARAVLALRTRLCGFGGRIGRTARALQNQADSLGAAPNSAAMH